LEPERREDEEGGGSWLSELSPVTLVVSVVTVLAVVAYGVLLVIEMFR
jgi:hypothetical protein